MEQLFNIRRATEYEAIPDGEYIGHRTMNEVRFVTPNGAYVATTVADCGDLNRPVTVTVRGREIWVSAIEG